jgi:hypothetical protein
MPTPREYYSTRIRDLTKAVDSLKKKSDGIAWLRLLVAITTVATVYGSVVLTLHILWLTIACIVIFLRLVQAHLKNKDEIECLTIIARLCSDEIRLIQGDHSVFDPGPAGAYQKHIYANDLDIFGTTSLFKSINRTVTFGGRRMMVDTLLELPADPALISRRKEAINDLAGRLAWRQRFFATGARSGEMPFDMEKIGQWITQPAFFEGRRRWLGIAAAACILSAAVIVWMVVLGRFLPAILIAVVVLNTGVLQLIGRDVKRYFAEFGSRTSLFRKFSEMFQLVSKEELSSPLGKELRESVTEASMAFMKLSRLHNLAEQRANGLVAVIMNGLFMFDIWTIFRIEKWRHEHMQRAMPWIDTLNQIDMLNSCSNFRFNHPEFCEAIVAVSAPGINAKGLGHPLLPTDSAVVNDYQIGSESRAHVITGSNMAGKSTFIRAVGLNVVLALNGLPVFARQFSCSVMEIASCVRITDSLEDHASYFRAELDRLALIVAMLQSGKPHLVLLDEILRGTNSDDKRHGTISFYRKLGQYNCVCLLATHDLTIGELAKEDPGRFANYCFESNVVANELRFDYMLKPGISKSANASYLMKKMNLID